MWASHFYGQIMLWPNQNTIFYPNSEPTKIVSDGQRYQLDFVGEWTKTVLLLIGELFAGNTTLELDSILTQSWIEFKFSWLWLYTLTLEMDFEIGTLNLTLGLDFGIGLNTFIMGLDLDCGNCSVELSCARHY